MEPLLAPKREARRERQAGELPELLKRRPRRQAGPEDALEAGDVVAELAHTDGRVLAEIAHQPLGHAQGLDDARAGLGRQEGGHPGLRLLNRRVEPEHPAHRHAEPGGASERREGPGERAGDRRADAHPLLFDLLQTPLGPRRARTGVIFGDDLRLDHVAAV